MLCSCSLFVARSPPCTPFLSPRSQSRDLPSTSLVASPIPPVIGRRTRHSNKMGTAVGAATSADASAAYDRTAELREFDESKIGVKGLVDSGVTSIPRFFHHQDLDLDTAPPSLSIPTIDLSLPRPEVVRLVSDACRDWGFFQAVNHGVPLDALSAAIDSVRAFHELPTPVKSAHYTRAATTSTGVSFNTNVDLYQSKAAQWRDTLQIRMAPVRPVAEKIPEACRAEVVEWDKRVREVGGMLMGILSEGLGAPPEKLEEMSCLDGRMMVCHYYPSCPQPDLTLGVASHTDPGLLTVLVQNQVNGLQVKQTSAGDGAQWVDVRPIPGALVINVGDLLQIISNNEYKSVEHRVVANSHLEARVSIAVFFNPGKNGTTDFYEPLPEIVAQGKPAQFRKFTVPEFMRVFFSKGLNSRGMVDHFRI